MRDALAYTGAVLLFFLVIYVLGVIAERIERVSERPPRRTWRPQHRRTPCRCAKPRVRAQ